MIFSLIVSLRNKFYDSKKYLKKSKIPVISIGNISSGGTGKTPTSILIAKLLIEEGFQPICIGRNIHPSSKGTIYSDPLHPINAEIIGDELSLIQRKFSIPILSTTSKSKAALEFEDYFLKNLTKPIYIIDDGFQHRAISRNVDIVLVDDETVNGHLLPFGRNREPINSLKRANIILNFCNQTSNEFLLNLCTEVFSAKKEYSNTYFLKIKPKNVNNDIFVISSIAKPEKLREDLQLQGNTIKGFIDFPDHYNYIAKDIFRITQQFQNSKASYFVTTEKDIVKLEKYSDFCNSYPILVYPQIVTIDDEPLLLKKIIEYITV